MFIGHYAPALFAAAVIPRAPRLAIGFVAVQLLDFGFFGLMLAGVEHMRLMPGITAMNPMDLYDMPWTHSMMGAAGWAAGFGILLWLSTRDVRSGAIAAGLVLSHWLIDLVVHRPDLTIAGSPPAFGLGLWNVPLLAIPLELAITFGALYWYQVRARALPMRTALLGLALLAAQAINWFGPQPTEVTPAIPLTSLAVYTLFALLAGWVDSSRRTQK